MIVIGHRANTPRWVRRFLPCVDGLELDVVLRSGAYHTTHMQPGRSGVLLREKLAHIIGNIHLTPAPRLEELLELIPAEKLLLFDLKTPISSSDAFRLAELVRGRGRVMVSTRHHHLAPLLRDAGFTVLLSLASRPASPPALVEAAGAHGVSIDSSVVDCELVSELRRRGYVVIVWTVNSVAELERLRAMGVDGVVTDIPCKLRSIAGGRV